MKNLGGACAIEVNVKYKGVQEFIERYEAKLEESINHIDMDESNIDEVAKELEVEACDIRTFLGYDQ